MVSKSCVGAHIGSLLLGVGHNNYIHDVAVAHYTTKGINVMGQSAYVYYFLLANADIVLWWESYRAMGI